MCDPGSTVRFFDKHAAGWRVGKVARVLKKGKRKGWLVVEYRKGSNDHRKVELPPTSVQAVKQEQDA